ncbi:MAG: sulfotransferase domain-containing protein [Agarilytica sp.]
MKVGDSKVIQKKGIFIIGIQKSGTTWLHNLLCQVSSISSNKIKEPHFFSLKEKLLENNLLKYCGLYDDQKEMFLDSSVSYFNDKNSWNNIKKYVPDHKVIVLTRKPESRIHSAYNHASSLPYGEESRSFVKCMDDIWAATGNNLYEKEKNAIEIAVQNGEINKDDADFHHRNFGWDFVSEFNCPYWHFHYFSNSFWEETVRELKEHFGEQLVVVSFEELKNDFEGNFKSIQEFVGVNPDHIVDTDVQEKYQTFVHRGVLADKIARTLGVLYRKLPVGGLDGVDTFKKKVKSMFYKRPQLTKFENKKMIELLDAFRESRKC